MHKSIIGLGGGGFTMEPKNPLLDLYILASSPKKNPKICFLPTASGDNEHYIHFFDTVFSQYPCTPTHLSIISPTISDIEDFLLSSDIIYVGGGNTKSMLALWREWGVDKALKKAYEQGTVLAGVSAGLVCWFEECITDSIPNKFTSLPCMGFLPGSACPHYDGQEGRPEAYHRLLEGGEISNGMALDDGVGVHFIDDKLERVISSQPKANAYRCYLDASGKAKEDLIRPEFLGASDNFDKYIAPAFKDLMEVEEVAEEYAHNPE